MDNRQINIEALRPGMRLAKAIYDGAGVLLLARGIEITPRFLRVLNRRGLESVTLQSAPPPHVSATSERVDRQEDPKALAAEVNRQPDLRLPSASKRARMSQTDLRAVVRRGLENHTISTDRLARVYEGLNGGHDISVRQLEATILAFIDMVFLDLDVLPLIMSMRGSKRDYPIDHCLNVAMMSITIASRLGMTREQMMETGLAALVQDVGMLRVPGEVHRLARPLAEAEWIEVRRHPSHTLDFLEAIQGFPPAARYACHQTHERGDGSGYPHQRPGLLISPYAKIVAVADAYAAMVQPRSYRAAMLPHEAVKNILVETSRNRLDRTVARAFVDCISVFPIGSFIELDDGSRAKVVRTNAGLHTRPLLEEIDADGKSTGTFIDLSRESDRKVVGVSASENTVGSAEDAGHVIATTTL